MDHLQASLGNVDSSAFWVVISISVSSDEFCDSTFYLIAFNAFLFIS